MRREDLFLGTRFQWTSLRALYRSLKRELDLEIKEASVASRDSLTIYVDAIAVSIYLTHYLHHVKERNLQQSNLSKEQSEFHLQIVHQKPWLPLSLQRKLVKSSSKVNES